MNESAGYGIKELSEETGVQPRTIHFYIKERLLPPPSVKGGGARYNERHLVLLKLTNHLKYTNLRLAEIREMLAECSDEALLELLEQAESGDLKVTSSRQGPSLGSRLDVRERDVSYADIMTRGVMTDRSRQQELPLDDRRHSRAERELWLRISICDGCEVNMREDLHPLLKKRLNTLIEDFRCTLPPP